MNNSTNPTNDKQELYTGLISTGFTILSFLVYKLVKKYTLNSDCRNNQLHITLSSLDTKINETHTYITTFFESMKNEIEKQDKYNKIIREHRDKSIIDYLPQTQSFSADIKNNQ